MAPNEFQEELTFQVPLSELYKFNKPEKIDDLVGNHRKGPPGSPAMHPAKRFIVSTIGIFFLMVGLIGLFGNNSNPLNILWLLLGFAIVWLFVARPEMEKRKAAARARSSEDPRVSLMFDGNKIVTRSQHYELTRDWPELIDYKKTKKGIHLYFVDGTETWLPIDVFYEKKEIHDLMELLQRKLQKPD